MRFSASLCVAAAALCIGQAASAADLARKAPPPPLIAPVALWTGCYIGGNLGGVWGNRGVTVNGFDVNTGNSDARFAVGGQIGCDYQTGNFVFGVRNLTDWANSNRTFGVIFGPAAGDVITIKNNWFDLLTARVGFTATPAWLFYVQGGAAWRNNEVTLFGPLGFGQLGSANGTRTGWTAGVGTEYRFAQNWSVFLEYNYASGGNNNVTFVVPPAFVLNATTRTNVSMVLAGVNWRF